MTFVCQQVAFEPSFSFAIYPYITRLLLIKLIKIFHWNLVYRKNVSITMHYMRQKDALEVSVEIY